MGRGWAGCVGSCWPCALGHGPRLRRLDKHVGAFFSPIEMYFPVSEARPPRNVNYTDLDIQTELRNHLGVGRKAASCLQQPISCSPAGIWALLSTGCAGRAAQSCQSSQLAQQQASTGAVCGSSSCWCKSPERYQEISVARHCPAARGLFCRVSFSVCFFSSSSGLAHVLGTAQAA